VRWSQYFINTLRDVPARPAVIRQKFMMRARMIRKVAAGICTYVMAWKFNCRRRPKELER
jgi:prolyl-tRNA synthetase